MTATTDERKSNRAAIRRDPSLGHIGRYWKPIIGRYPLFVQVFGSTKISETAQGLTVCTDKMNLRTLLSQ